MFRFSYSSKAAIISLVAVMQFAPLKGLADTPDVNMIYVQPSDHNRVTTESALLPKDLFVSERSYLEGFAWPKPITVWIGDCKQGGSEYVSDARKPL